MMAEGERMAGKPAISKDEILDVAYARAQQDGLGSLSIRSVARECGVAVGTLYNYFPDKASLVSAIVLKFWRKAVEACVLEPASEDESVIDYCRRLGSSMEHFLAGFKTNWLREISMLDEATLALVRRDEDKCLHAVYESIDAAIARDKRIGLRAKENLSHHELARLIWRVTFDSLRSHTQLYEEFLNLLSLALYEA